MGQHLHFSSNAYLFVLVINCLECLIKGPIGWQETDKFNFSFLFNSYAKLQVEKNIGKESNSWNNSFDIGHVFVLFLLSNVNCN
jgi:hypothetical protein